MHGAARRRQQPRRHRRAAHVLEHRIGLEFGHPLLQGIQGLRFALHGEGSLFIQLENK
jgi:hypothetical protein